MLTSTFSGSNPIEVDGCFQDVKIPIEVDGYFQDVKILSTSPPGGTLTRGHRVSGSLKNLRLEKIDL